jgi:hypothetical protein
MDVDRAERLTRTPPVGLLSRLPTPMHLGLLVAASLPVMLAMSLAWWVLYPAWLLTRPRPSTP